MKLLLPFAIVFFFLTSIVDQWSSAALTIFLYYLIIFVQRLSSEIPFRHFILLIYSLNFLFSPAVLMNLPNYQDLRFEKINIPLDRFFGITIPSIFALHLGLFLFKIKMFKPKFDLLKIELLANESIFRVFVFVGIFFNMISGIQEGAVGYILTLIGLLRFVGVFALFFINKKRSAPYLLLVFFLSFTNAFSWGMFGDFIQWSTFFLMLFFYINKLGNIVKYSILLLAFALIFLLQTFKGDYREKTWNGLEEAGVETMINTSKNKEKEILSNSTIASNLERFNQSWILGKVINKTDYTQDFQEFTIIKLYFESAFLPRFLAPNKLNSSDRELFARFTGHTLQGTTSMGMGVLADGYIAYGYWGTILAAFILGIIINIVCKAIESWTKISPFFLLFSFPVLFYAIRPDCDTQTLLGNLFKSLVLYWIIVRLVKGNLKKLVQFGNISKTTISA